MTEPPSARSQSRASDPFYHTQFHPSELENKKNFFISKATDRSSQDGITGEYKSLKTKSDRRGVAETLECKEDEVLDHIHKMRLKTFEKRANDPQNVKPYLPMLSSDEKELILEQYFASKKKLNVV